MLNSLALPPAAMQLMDRVGGPHRAGILGVGVLSVLVILATARWATAPTWVPVFSGMPLEAVGPITERLTEEGIAFELANGGSELRVTTADLARARVSLARDGLSTGARPGLELFDQPSWGMTDFTQRINYRRALEGELERTIGKMRGVEGAKVHLAMDDAPGLRRTARPVEASVVLRLRGGATPTPDMVQGIGHLVASSVDGVEAERVTVLDDSGKMLSSPFEAGSATGVAARELKMRNEIETYLATKAEQMVAQVVGPGNVRIQISADINLDRIERTVETVDPEQQALTNEQRSEIIPGPQGGAGSTSVTASYLNSRSLETYSGAVGNVKRLTASVLVNDREVTTEEGRGFEPRTAAELDRIESLVKNAVGIDEGRGDLIAVVSIPFDDGRFPEELKMGVWGIFAQVQRPAIAVLALLLTFAVVMRVTRGLRTPEPAQIAALAGADEDGVPALEAGGDLELGAGGDLLNALGVGEAANAQKSSGVRELVAARLQEQPEASTRLIRAWLKEA